MEQDREQSRGSKGTCRVNRRMNEAVLQGGVPPTQDRRTGGLIYGITPRIRVHRAL